MALRSVQLFAGVRGLIGAPRVDGVEPAQVQSYGYRAAANAAWLPPELPAGQGYAPASVSEFVQA